MEKAVVAGAGFAGIQAAFSLARKGYNVEIIDRSEKHVFRPGLIDLVRRTGKEKIQVDLEKLFEDSSVDFFQEEITSINPEEKTVEAGRTHEYDYLVLALGGEPIIPEGLEEANIPYTTEEASKLGEMDGSAAIIGAGYTGLEYGFELSEKGLDVSVFEAETRPLPGFSRKVSEKVLDSLHGKLKFRGGKHIFSVTDGRIEFEEGEENFDHVIVCIGVKRNSLIDRCFEDFRVNSGLCCVQYPDIFAVGDSSYVNRNTAHNAIIEGRKVAENIDRDESQELKPIEVEQPGFLLSAGKTGLYIRGDRVFKSRIFRYVKDAVRKLYFFRLRKKA
ncbi:MAG: NAD(P)/FAD-dependent oxidoreductase [Candidatus Nanohaloarchaea archaeon]